MTPTPPSLDGAPGLRQDVLDWFTRRQRDDWSAQDETAFQVWLCADASHRQAYTHWESCWRAVDRIGAEAVAQLRRNLARDQAQQGTALAADGDHAPPWPRHPRSTRRRWLMPAFGMALGVAVLCGSGVLAWNHWQAQPVFAQTFSTPRGKQVEATLPDGSRLRLDTATRLEVAYYRQRREVTLLEGQAVFAVQSDSARPFQVAAGPVGVTVVGTRFSVRYTPALAGNDGVRVAVEQGAVQVARRAGEASTTLPGAADAVQLTAGQQVVVNVEGPLAAVVPVPSEGIAPWRDSRISFVNTPLSQALAELERYGSTGLTVRDPAVAALRLSGTFDPRDVQTLRQILPSALPVRLQTLTDTTEVVLAR